MLFMKQFNNFLFCCSVCQVIPFEGQSEQSQGVCAHLVPPPEDQALPDPTGQSQSHYTIHSHYTAGNLSCSLLRSAKIRHRQITALLSEKDTTLKMLTFLGG